MSAFDAFTAVTDALSLLNGTRLDPEVQAPLDRLRVQARELRNFCKAAGQAFSWIDDDFRTAIRNEILSAAVRRDSTALARTAIELDEISDLLNSVIESIEEAEPGERERSLRRHARAATRASEVFWRWAMAQTDSGHTLDALDKSETLEQLSGDLRTIANIFKESKDSLSTFREILEFVRAQHDSATRNWDRIARLNSDIRGERAARQILEEFGVAPELDDSLFRLIEEIIYTDDQSGIRQARQTIEAFRIALFEGGMDPDRADRIASEFSKWVNR